MPGVVGGGEEIVGAVELAIVDRVIEVGELDGDEAGDEGETVIGEAEESELVTAEFELAIAVEFVLLAMLEAIEEAVAVRGFGGEPSIGGEIFRAPAGDEIDIAIIAGELEEGVDTLAGDVSGSEIDGVVAFADVEGATIDGDGIDDCGD